MWPLTTDSRSSATYQSALDANQGNDRFSEADKVFRFCSTIGGRDYFFLRQNNWRTDVDMMQPRNQQLWNYIRNFLGSPIPGYGGNFVSKYGAEDVDQLVTQMFDYCRSGADLYNLTKIIEVPAGSGITIDGRPRRGYSNNDQDGDWNAIYPSWNCIGLSGVVVPLRYNNTQGFGNFIYPTQVALLFRCEDQAYYNNPNTPGIGIDINVPTPGRTTYRIRAYILVQTYRPTSSTASFGPYAGNNAKSSNRLTYNTGIALTINSMDSFRLETPEGIGAPMQFPIGETTGAVSVGSPDGILDLMGMGQNEAYYSPGIFMNRTDRDNDAARTTGVGGSFLATQLIPLDYPTPLRTQSPPIPFTNNDLVVRAGLPIRQIEEYRTELDSNLRMNFTGGKIQMSLNFLSGPDGTNRETIQNFEVEFPSIQGLVIPHQDFSAMLRDGSRMAGDPAREFFRRDTLSQRRLAGHAIWTILTEGRDKDAYPTPQPSYDNRDTTLTSLNNLGQIVFGSTVVRAVEIDAASPYADWRLAAISRNMPAELFKPVNPTDYNNPLVRHVHAMGRNATGRWLEERYSSRLLRDATYYQGGDATLRTTSSAVNGAFMLGGTIPGDWDSSTGTSRRGACGALINAPDSGSAGRSPYIVGVNPNGGGENPDSYFNFDAIVDAYDQAYSAYVTFSPNRQMYSAMQFGSLPSQAVSRRPWQTLLFTKHPAAGPAHPGFATPPDHVIADLFWSPVVEPYPISEPLSTAGKINMNYGMVPFTGIQRKTALHALLKSTMVSAVPTAHTLAFKSATAEVGARYRVPINNEETLIQFDAKFATNQVFKSATEISEMSLVPVSQSLTGVQSWWNGMQNTGDNMREQPYAHLHSRLTTKSNTFMVHYKVQALKQRGRGDPTIWEEGRDEVLSEHRGSTLLERYIDPADPRLPDFADPSVPETTKSIDQYYRFRVINTKTFMP